MYKAIWHIEEPSLKMTGATPLEAVANLERFVRSMDKYSIFLGGCEPFQYEEWTITMTDETVEPVVVTEEDVNGIYCEGVLVGKVERIVE